MWFRLYTELLNDPKAQRLPGEQFKGWINLLCIAKEHGGLIPPIEDIAFQLRMSDGDAKCLVEELVKRGLLDTDGETVRPHNWDERQFVSDNSTERVRRHRAGAGDLQKSGKIKYVYFIGVSLDQTVKIGISKNPWARLSDIQSEMVDPQLSVLATFRADTYSEVAIHKLLDKYRKYGEWFELPEHVQHAVSVAATSKQTYDQLMELLRGILRSSTSELRSEAVGEATESGYATTTEQIQSRTEPETEQSRADASRGKPRSARSPVLPDDEFLDGLQKNPAYSMLNVRHCYQRMMTWCQVNSKQPSRRRFINWLNREDKPMTAPTKNGGRPQVGAPLPAKELPADDYMAESIEELIAVDDIVSIGQMYDGIVQRGGAKAAWEIRCVAWYELHKDEPATPEQMAELNASIQTLANR